MAGMEGSGEEIMRWSCHDECMDVVYIVWTAPFNDYLTTLIELSCITPVSYV